MSQREDSLRPILNNPHMSASTDHDMGMNNKKQVLSTELMHARAKRRDRTHDSKAVTSEGNDSAMVKIEDLLQNGKTKNNAQTVLSRRTEIKK